MRDHRAPGPLLDAVDRYFALMYDNDVSRFEEIFAPSAQLHGFRDGSLRIIAAAEYRDALASHASPLSKGSPRLQEVIAVDFAAPRQAVVKVRVRIDAHQYLDQLSWLLTDEGWRVVAKSFHIERVHDGS